MAKKKSELDTIKLDKPAHISEDWLRQALTDGYGNITAIAKHSGFTRWQLYGAIERFNLQDHLEHSRKNFKVHIVESAEQSLLRQIENDNTIATIFTLKAQGNWSEDKKIDIDKDALELLPRLLRAIEGLGYSHADFFREILREIQAQQQPTDTPQIVSGDVLDSAGESGAVDS